MIGMGDIHINELPGDPNGHRAAQEMDNDTEVAGERVGRLVQADWR